MQLFKESKSVCGFDLKQIRNFPELKKEAMTDLFKLYREGKIKPHIDHVFAFEEVSFHWSIYNWWKQGHYGGGLLPVEAYEEI